jgi:hypothetical protein
MKNTVHHTQYNENQSLTAHEESITAPLFVHVEISNFGLVVSRFLYDAPRQCCLPAFFAHFFLSCSSFLQREARENGEQKVVLKDLYDRTHHNDGTLVTKQPTVVELLSRFPAESRVCSSS